MFHEKSLKSSVRRSFQITIGLTEGYGTDIRHTPEEILVCIGLWMKETLSAERRCLTGGTLVPGTMVYAWNSAATGVVVNQEDSVLFVGEVNPLYNADLTDDEVLDILKDLASYVGERFHQTRMYILYRDRILILENSDSPHPTGT